MTSYTGNLYILSAPSGTGKGTLIKGLLECEPKLRLSISHTTRPPRPGERDGVHYHFVDRDTFIDMVTAGAFVEHAEVFGNLYGTSEAAIREPLVAGQDIVLEIDWQGARQVRKRFPENCSIFILPPSLEALRERLQGRGQDAPEVIEDRLAKAAGEVAHYGEYDYLLVNDRLDRAQEQLLAVVHAYALREPAQAVRLAALLGELQGP